MERHIIQEFMSDNNPQIYQHWQQRSDQENLDHNRQRLAQLVINFENASSETRVVYSHIPKNAGTTLEYILSKNQRLSDVLHVNAPDLNKQPDLLNLKKNSARLICGHHPMHGLLYQLLSDEPLIHMTMLRNPLDRVISYYNYISGNQQHPFHEAVSDMPIDAFIEHPQLTEISNGQAKRLSGYLHSNDSYDEDVLFATAKKVLEQCFTVVLITEQFNQSLLILQKMLNLQDIYYLPHNQSTKRIEKTHLTPQQQKRILQRNTVDERLHTHFQEQFIQLCQQHLPENALETFQQRQQQWRALQNT
ncbi:sulfotransferase family 2 domain-containing protein [Marinicella sp. W31]|uniref:sulfotransferase family 2 domain-containing protein n=1 Tax=Marinicella sp. W31 TaxID=3023713 RepID=UPI0037583E91